MVIPNPAWTDAAQGGSLAISSRLPYANFGSSALAEPPMRAKPAATNTAIFDARMVASRRLEPGVYFRRESRISRSRTMSSGVAAGAAGGASFFNLFTCFTIMKMMNARIRKLMAMVMKLP